MQGQSLVYSNARVKAMENSLLSQEKITRMTFAESLAEAVKVLYESNYAGGVIVDSPYDFASILKEEEARVVGFMREAMPNKSGLESLLMPLDYHNAKAFSKAKLTGMKDYKAMLAESGNIDRNVIEDAIMNGDFSLLPKPMADALDKIFENREGSVSPRFIDITLDKALYQDVLAVSGGQKSKSLKKYWVASIDMLNISSMLRCKRIDASEKFFLEGFIPGGNVADYVLRDLLKESYEAILEKLKYTDYGSLVAIAVEEAKSEMPLVRFEAECDNYLLDIFKLDKADIFSIAPLAGFYIAKKIELKMVRMILTSIKNNASESEIKARLRGFYA